MWNLRAKLMMIPRTFLCDRHGIVFPWDASLILVGKTAQESQGGS